MIREQLGRYRVVELLGRGGMGRVFLAEDPMLGRRVAIKVLPPEFASDPERRARLLHEARAASALNHPNILTVFDLGEEEGVLYVATEVVDGETVRVWGEREPRTPAEVLGVMRQAANALAQAHAAGLVHRDIKPENLMVRRDGLVKVLDFGLARSLTPGQLGAATATLPGVLVGTAGYMSPEQVLARPAGPPSDVFSLATVLYELLTGRHPFAASSGVETMHRILHDAPEPPTRLNPGLSPDFDFVLAKALTKDPARRHQSARDLEIDLETLECGCGAASSASRRASGGNGGPRAIAVLPFKNVGGDPELDYLGIGLADAVITGLAGSPDLIVRATSSIARYANQPVDPRHVGQELDVTAVLDASFQRSGDRFRATARLVETPGGRALWAGKVDVRFEDVFEVQDRVAQGIADALTARLSSVARAAAFTPSHEAFALRMRAHEAARAGTMQGFQRTIEMLEQAVRLEPRYSRAWADLGNIYLSMVDGGFDPDPRWYGKTEAALSRALAIDPEDGFAHFGLGMLHLVRGQKREAHREFVGCLARIPNLWNLYHYFGYLFRLCDMMDEALAAMRHALEVEPTAPWPHWGQVRVHLLRGDAPAAKAALERAGFRFGSHPRYAAMELSILRAEGRYAEALEFIRQRHVVMEPIGSTEFDRAFCLIQTGDPEGAEPHVARCETFGETDMDEAAMAAILNAHLGRADRAFHFLDRARELGNDTLSAYADPVTFGPLHSDPRWEPYLAGVRERVARWKREFRWPPSQG
ncbi:MAG TPA: protein kinase [Candidatus Eisenbacteria bacterium]